MNSNSQTIASKTIKNTAQYMALRAVVCLVFALLIIFVASLVFLPQMASASTTYGTPYNSTPYYSTPAYGTPYNSTPYQSTPAYGTPYNSTPHQGTPATNVTPDGLNVVNTNSGTTPQNRFDPVTGLNTVGTTNQTRPNTTTGSYRFDPVTGLNVIDPTRPGSATGLNNPGTGLNTVSTTNTGQNTSNSTVTTNTSNNPQTPGPGTGLNTVGRNNNPVNNTPVQSYTYPGYATPVSNYVAQSAAYVSQGSYPSYARPVTQYTAPMNNAPQVFPVPSYQTPVTSYAGVSSTNLAFPYPTYGPTPLYGSVAPANGYYAPTGSVNNIPTTSGNQNSNPNRNFQITPGGFVMTNSGY